jgi:tetratricopeptide (TPR) repeat protein
LEAYDSGHWATRLQESVLSRADVQSFRHDLVELLALLARMEMDQKEEKRKPGLQTAVSLLTRALAVDDIVPSVYRLRAECYACLDEPVAAASDLRRAEELPAVQAIDHYLQAEDYRQRGKFAEAIRLYGRTLEREPQHYGAQCMLGVAWYESGETQRATEAFDHALRLRPHAAVYAARALSLAADRQWESALADLERAEKLSPRLAGVWLNRGVVLYLQATDPRATLMREQSRKLLRQAEAQFQRCRLLSPASPAAWNNIGNVERQRANWHLEEGQVEEERAAAKRAIDAYSEALEIAPKHFRALLNRGAMHARSGDYVAALTDLQSLSAQDFNVQLCLGQVHELRGRAAAESGAIRTAQDYLQKSRLHYSRAIELQSAAYEGYLHRAASGYELLQLALRHGELRVAPPSTTEVLADLDQADQRAEGRMPAAEQARLFGMRAVLGKELADFDRALRISPNQPMLRVRRGWALAASYPGNALADFEAALQHPEAMDAVERADALTGRGLARVQQGQDAEAVRDAESAVELAPQQWQILFNAAVIYALAGDLAEHENSSPNQAEQRRLAAVNQLGRAARAGLHDKQLIADQRAFVSLRARHDFQQLLE